MNGRTPSKPDRRPKRRECQPKRRHAGGMSIDEVRDALKCLAAAGLISEANGISWDDDPDLPRTIIIHDASTVEGQRLLDIAEAHYEAIE